MLTASSSLTAFLGDYSPYFSLFGAIAAVYCGFAFSVSLWDGLNTFCFARILRRTVDFKTMGDWAVVTGATDGIGKEFSRELARRGLNIVLISRSLDKLQQVSRVIEKESNVLTKCIVVDFTDNATIYATVRRELKDKDVGVLINNVGLMYDVPDYFLQIKGEQKMVVDMVNVNCLASVMMTRILLSGMIERRRGVIINIGSGAGVRPVPLFTLYSATKAFSDFFALGLHEECRDYGVFVQSLMPYSVATTTSNTRPIWGLIPPCETLAKRALDTVCMQKRTFGCIAHATQGFIATRMSDWMFYAVSWTILSSFSRIVNKRRALKNKKQN